jgi:hypothetical protein
VERKTAKQLGFGKASEDFLGPDPGACEPLLALSEFAVKANGPAATGPNFKERSEPMKPREPPNK